MDQAKNSYTMLEIKEEKQKMLQHTMGILISFSLLSNNTLILLGGFFHEIFPCFEHSWINTSFFLSWQKNHGNIDVFNFQRTFVSISTIYGYLFTPAKPMPTFNEQVNSCIFCTFAIVATRLLVID